MAVLACAVVLVVSPPIVAVISMVDPDALTNLSQWLERLSPEFTYLDYAKAALTVGSLALVWRSPENLD